MTAISLPRNSIMNTKNMRQFHSGRVLRVFRNLLLLGCSLSLCWCDTVPPKIFDCHVHHNGSENFLQKLVTKLESLQGMALLITMPKDLDQVTAFMKTHPGRLVGLGE